MKINQLVDLEYMVWFDKYDKLLWIIYINIYRSKVNPPKTMPFPIKAKVIRVPGVNIIVDISSYYIMIIYFRFQVQYNL